MDYNCTDHKSEHDASMCSVSARNYGTLSGASSSPVSILMTLRWLRMMESHLKVQYSQTDEHT